MVILMVDLIVNLVIVLLVVLMVMLIVVLMVVLLVMVLIVHTDGHLDCQSSRFLMTMFIPRLRTSSSLTRVTLSSVTSAQPQPGCRIQRSR